MATMTGFAKEKKTLNNRQTQTDKQTDTNDSSFLRITRSQCMSATTLKEPKLYLPYLNKISPNLCNFQCKLFDQ
jgi:hypothetical protein